MNNTQIKAGIVLSYLTIFLGLFISIIYTPFMLRSLGENQYGLYTLITSIVGYLGLLNFGFSTSYMRYYSRYKASNDDKSIKRLNGMFWVVFLALGALILIIGAALTPNLSSIMGDKISGADLDIARALFCIMVVNLAIPLFTTPFNLYVIAHEKFILLKTVHLVKTVLNPIIMIPILLLGYKAIALSLVTLIFTVLCEIAITIYAIKKLKIKFIFKNLDFSLMKEIGRFSFFIFLLMIIDQINWNVDKILLGRMKGTEAVAIYGVAFQINHYYLMLSTQISSVFIPRVNTIVAKQNSDKELTTLFTRIGRIQYMLLACVFIGFLFFGEKFVQIWAGESYSDAYYVILLLIGPVTFSLIQNIGIEIQRAKNMHKTITVIYLGLAILNVFVSIPLIDKYSVVGAALGTAVSLVIGNIFIVNWYYHTKVGLDVISFWKEIGQLSLAMVVPVLVGGLLNHYMNFENLLIYVTSGGIFAIVYIFFIWKFGMNDTEKQIILRIKQKVLHHMSTRRSKKMVGQQS